ncbi:MAG: flagellar motor protein [Bdellovibrionales bacterium]|nr:flagellar motor protein [Bdellovibrionales bacterium]
MSPTTILGLLLGFGGILIGNMLEGGHVQALFQLGAALVVLGGTWGAVLISNRSQDIRAGFQLLGKITAERKNTTYNSTAQEIIDSAQIVRKESLLSLENRIPLLPNPFMKNVFRFLIDGVDGETLQQIFQNQVALEQRKQLDACRIWSDAGGFSPTIGIIGAVLGLIHVLANLTDTTSLGHGIAMAFVATIYGVAFANLLYLPLANKLQRLIKEESQYKMMIIEGAVAIAKGLNPYLVQEKMFSYIHRSSLKSPVPNLNFVKKNMESKVQANVT